MFFKRKLKNTPYFIFNYGCSAPQKCVSLSAENGTLSADWYNESGEHHCFTDVPFADGFWTALYTAAEECGLLEWKAHKLFNRFASEISLEVFNAEGLFPNGVRLEADNKHGLPDGFEEAVKKLTEVFFTFAKTN